MGWYATISLRIHSRITITKKIARMKDTCGLQQPAAPVMAQILEIVPVMELAPEMVPMTVLEELDNIKGKRDRDVSREARIAINTIDGYLGDATPQQISAGVALPRVNGVDPGSLAVFPDQLIADEDDDIPFLSSGPHQANDNRIINNYS